MGACPGKKVQSTVSSSDITSSEDVNVFQMLKYHWELTSLCDHQDLLGKYFMYSLGTIRVQIKNVYNVGAPCTSQWVYNQCL